MRLFISTMFQNVQEVFLTLRTKNTYVPGKAPQVLNAHLTHFFVFITPTSGARHPNFESDSRSTRSWGGFCFFNVDKC